MKILITYENYFPKISGVPVVLKYMAEGLVNKGHEVTVVTGSIKGVVSEEEINGVLVKRFNARTTRCGYVGDKDKYVKYVKGFNGDVIIMVCSQCWTTDWLLDILDDIKVPKVFYPHGYSGLGIALDFNVSLIGLKKFAGKIIAKSRWKKYYTNFYKYLFKMDHIIYLSESDTAKIYGDKYNIKNYSIIENAANEIYYNKKIKDKKENLSKLKIDNNEKFLIYVSNYLPGKNQEFALEAFYKSKLEEQYKMIFIGNNVNGDSYYKYLINRKNDWDKKYGERKVFFYTKVDREVIATCVSNAQISLFSSKHEQYPLVIIESMASGVPFISTNVGNVSRMPGGVIVNTVNEMAEIINELVNDNNKRKELGEMGEEYAMKNCTTEKAVDELENIIVNLANDSKVKGEENEK